MEILDLHYVKEDPDLGIAGEGVLFKDAKEIIGRINKVKKTVKSIDLNYQSALRKIPEVIKECTLLEKLNISHTGIIEVPDFVFEMPNLIDLSICCPELPKFPMNVFKAAKLQRLHIRVNKDWNTPTEIPALPDLKIFTMDLYTQAAMPNNLGILKKLELVSMATKYSEGDVPDLPSSLKNHPSLKEFILTDTFYRNRKKFNLVNAAKILSTCPNFEVLRLNGIAVGKGHEALSILKKLKKLKMRHLLVEGNVFKSIANLEKLESFGIWGSEYQITEIPDIFKNLKELQRFTFAGNMITAFPPSLYELPKLRVLQIGSTGISELDEKIGNLKSLEKIHIYDSILEKLPEAIFTLPNLKILNIEENIFNANEIKNITGKLNQLAQNGQKIDFIYDRQGYRQMVKKLRALNANNGSKINAMSPENYFKYCLNGVMENSFAIKYVNAEKLGSKLYAELCMAAVRETSSVLEVITHEVPGKKYYFPVCMQAAKNTDIGVFFGLIKGNLLTDNEYIQVCLLAALHNKSANFISFFNTEAFQKRFNREIYERICWTAALHYPKTASKMLK